MITAYGFPVVPQPTSEADLLCFPTAERRAELAVLPYREYLISPEWRERRRIEISAAGYVCQICGIYGERRRFQVHHLTYERRGDELPEDLLVLCGDCHRDVHGIAR